MILRASTEQSSLLLSQTRFSFHAFSQPKNNNLVINNIVYLGLLPDVPEAEPGLEDGQVVEDLGVHEVQEGPELF